LIFAVDNQTNTETRCEDKAAFKYGKTKVRYRNKVALMDNVNDREIYMKGIDHSYYYEGYYVFKMENLTNTKD